VMFASGPVPGDDAGRGHRRGLDGLTLPAESVSHSYTMNRLTQPELRASFLRTASG
jgi:hypothetical protein